MRRLRTHWVLLSVTCIGVFLRFTNLNWDLGSRLHPDEALIVNGSLAITFFSQLSPGFHDYNGLSVYLLKAASLIASFLFRSPYWSVTPEGVTVVGRFVSALLSSLAIPLLYILGKQLWKKETGIIAATLLAFTPLLIQLAHFYTTESMLIFLELLLLFAILRYARDPNRHSLVRMSIPVGLLLATKNTAYLFVPIPIAAIIVSNQQAYGKVRALALFLIVSITTFFAASPYSFIDLTGYLLRSRYLTDVVSGRLLMDWTMQFQDTTGLFWILNLLFAFGPLSILGPIGIVGFLSNNYKTWKKPLYVIAMWCIGFLIFLACTYLKFTRYSAPLIPFFALFAAKFLRDIPKTRIGKILLYGAIGSQLLSGLMFFSVYTTDHTSVTAAQWISTHVPPDSVILIEEWNSIVRFSRPEVMRQNYQLISFNFYTLPDDAAKQQQLTKAISKAEYIVIESPKVKNTVTRLRSRYPHSKKFYEDLENGKLGFTKVATFTSYPRFGPFISNDDSAEETFTVFDHPTITIYRNNLK